MSLELEKLVEYQKSPKKKKNREREFLVDLKNTFESYGAFWHKISDSPIFPGMKTRFEKSKPFDAMAIYKGIPIAIEAKFIDDYKAFGIKTLREVQREGLSKWQKSGGVSFVFLNIRRVADKSANMKRINRMLIFNFKDLEKMEKNIIKKDLMQKPFYECFRKKYNLGMWLKELSE